LGASGAVELAALKQHWATLAGTAAAGHSRPVSLRRGLLVVETDDAVWASELRLLQGGLLRRVKALAPSVEGLRLQVSPHRATDW